MAEDEIDVRLRKVRATLGARQPLTQARDRSDESRPGVPQLVLPVLPLDPGLVLPVEPGLVLPAVPGLVPAAPGLVPAAPGLVLVAAANADEELAVRVYESLAGDPLRLRTFRRYLRKLTGTNG
jgi:hypothetical protein